MSVYVCACVCMRVCETETNRAITEFAPVVPHREHHNKRELSHIHIPFPASEDLIEIWYKTLIHGQETTWLGTTNDGDSSNDNFYVDSNF